MRLTVRTTAHSGVVGQGLVLEAEDGRVIGQLALLGSTQVVDYKAYAGAVAASLAGSTVEVPDDLVRPHPRRAVSV